MYTHVHVLMRDDKEERKKERSMVKQTNKAKKHMYMWSTCRHSCIYTYTLCPTRGRSFSLGKVTALGVLCCFALLFV